MTKSPCLQRCCRFNRNKLWRLYVEGNKRIEKEFDLVEILTSLRNLKILSNYSLDAKTKAKLAKNRNNAIDLDKQSSAYDSSSSSDSSSSVVSSSGSGSSGSDQENSSKSKGSEANREEAKDDDLRASEIGK